MAYIVPYRSFEYDNNGEKVYNKKDGCKYEFIDWNVTPETEKTFNSYYEIAKFVEGNVNLDCPVITFQGETHQRDIIIVGRNYVEFYHSRPGYGGYCVHTLYQIKMDENVSDDF
jgi:hypothetical protein